MIINKEDIHAIGLLISMKQTYYNDISTLADNQCISKEHAYKLTRKLLKAGLIKSIKGREGGYYLNKPLSDISFFDVHQAISENSKTNHKDAKKLINKHSKNDKMQEQLNKIDENIRKLLMKSKLKNMS